MEIIAELTNIVQICLDNPAETFVAVFVGFVIGGGLVSNKTNDEPNP